MLKLTVILDSLRYFDRCWFLLIKKTLTLSQFLIKVHFKIVISKDANVENATTEMKVVRYAT
jgi:hypothetical protein